MIPYNIKLISTRSAKFAGSVYFLLLGLINFVATYLNAEVKLLDTITLSVCILPSLIGKKWFLFIFGVTGVFISVYVIIGALAITMKAHGQTSNISFFMGFLLTGSMLLSSLLLIYASSGSWRNSAVLKQIA